MSGDPNCDQVERFLSDLKGLPADAWGEVIYHVSQVAGAPIYAQASERMVAIIRAVPGRVGEAMAADLQTLDAINAALGLQELDQTYRDDERLLTSATNASHAILFRDLLSHDDFSTLLYPFDLLLKPELRELSRIAATPSRGCMPGAALIVLIGGILMLRRSRVDVEVGGG